MTARSQLVAERRRTVLALYEVGRTQPEIAAELGMPRSTVALDLKSSPGYRPRTAAAAALHGQITAESAAGRFGVDLWSLCIAIDSSVVRGERIVNGKRVTRIVDPAELADDLASLPLCLYDGCDQRAIAPSGCCSGAHARALETLGTKRPGDTCRRIAEGKRGKPRPDVSKRMAAMHADGRAHTEWQVNTLEGRKASPTSSASPASLRRAKFKLAGYKVDSRGRPRKYTEEQAENVRQLKDRNPSYGRKTLARITGFSEKQVRAMLGA